MIEGHCECGAVRYRVEGDVHDYSHCHCSQCRRLHGAAFASFAGVRRDDFRLLSGADMIRSYASSPSHDRRFCGNCGSNLLVALTDEPEDYYLAMGTIDGDPALPPAYHIFVGSKAPWYEIADTAPQFEAFPDEDS